MASWSGRAASFFDDWKHDNAAVEGGSGLGTGPDERPRRRSPRIAIAALLVAGVATGAVVLPGSSAGADPSASTWKRLRTCESSDNYRTNTGNGHYGAYQFDVATWRSVGGTGLPSNASKAEQDARALILYRERGWQPWQCAGILGLRDDKDARSGRISDIKIGATSSTKPGKPTRTSGVPAFPGGSHWYVYGDKSAHIRTFQNQMHKRGFIPAGTGTYGPLTRAVVKQLQRLNGLAVTGFIGPNTWRLAWTGRYAKPGTPVAKVPAFPGGKHWYVYGDRSAHIKTFQNQMHKRGFIPAGTGTYGPLTRTVVKQLQRLNGLPVTGSIGPNTWRLAWTGAYHS